MPVSKTVQAGGVFLAIFNSDLSLYVSFLSSQPLTLPRSSVALIRRLTSLSVPFIYIPQAQASEAERRLQAQSEREGSTAEVIKLDLSEATWKANSESQIDRKHQQPAPTDCNEKLFMKH